MSNNVIFDVRPEDRIKEKRRGLLQSFVDDVYVFQSR